MEIADESVIKLISYLLPGFLAAWVYYSLTAHLKTTTFERIVQALIFLAFTKMAFFPFRKCLLFVGDYWSVAPWNTETELIALNICALLVGLFAVWVIYNGSLHELLRFCEVTERTPFPSEWNHALYSERRFVLLHMKDDDEKIWGWPKLYPDHPDKGHFLIQHPQYALQEGDELQSKPMPQVEHVLISVDSVKRVDFLIPREPIEDDTKTLPKIIKTHFRTCLEFCKGLLGKGEQKMVEGNPNRQHPPDKNSMERGYNGNSPQSPETVIKPTTNSSQSSPQTVSPKDEKK